MASLISKQPKPPELRAMTPEQLDLTLTDVIKSLVELRFQAVTDENRNTASASRLKKTIARIKTIQHERDLAAATA